MVERTIGITVDVDDAFSPEDIDELPQDLFLLGLLRAHAEQRGLSQTILSAQFDPLATQLLMLIDDAPSSKAVLPQMN